MKLSMFTAALLCLATHTSQAAVLNHYHCVDNTTKLSVADISLEPGCESFGCAAVSYGDSQKAVGSYTAMEGQCPSRNCGSRHLKIKARSTGMSNHWPVENVSLFLSETPERTLGDITFEMKDGVPERNFSISCTEF